MWACSACSLENDATHRRCVLCNTRQPPQLSVTAAGEKFPRSNMPKKTAVATMTRTKERPPETAEATTARTNERPSETAEVTTTRAKGRLIQKAVHTRASLSKAPVPEASIDAASEEKAPLVDVDCFIDVHLEGGQKASSALGDHLEALGATVRARFTAKATHIIFQGGNTEKAARSRAAGVFVVAPSWVEACRSQLARVPEAGFQAELCKAQKRPARTLEPAADLRLLSPTDALFSSSQRCEDGPQHPAKRRHAGLRIAQLPDDEEEEEMSGVDEEACAGVTMSLSGFEPAERATLVAAIRAVGARSARPLQVRADGDPMAKVTHLVVHESQRRTLRVVGALLHGAFLVHASFVYTALDADWPREDEHGFAKWPPAREARGAVLRGHRVVVDAKEATPPREVLLRVVALAGGEVVSDLSNATLFLSASADAAPGRRKVQCMNPGDLFDAIETGTPLEV